MKHLLILALIATVSFAMTAECELATETATIVHWSYVNGDANLTHAANVSAKMDRICQAG